MDGSPNAEFYIFTKMNETFRTNKKKIKNNFFKPFEDDPTSPEMYANLPSYVDPTQFRRCVEELWVSEKGKV